MRIVSISDTYTKTVGSKDPEFMGKSGRPCALILKLRFRGQRHDFAIPFRSNISPTTPKDQYFPLPPRPKTKPKHRHGIHYIKMFPIRKTDQLKFRISGNAYYENIQRILNINEKQIVSDAQKYLRNYEENGKPRFAVDIDKLIGQICIQNLRDRTE